MSNARTCRLVFTAVLVVMVAVGGMWLAFAEDPGEDLWTVITSSSGRERQRGEDLVLSIRHAQIQPLRSMITQPIEEGEQFFISNTPRNTAIRLLGRMRAKEAVPDLIPLLVPQDGQGRAVLGLPVAPTLRALVEIGLPAVGPLLETLKVEGTSDLSPFHLGTHCLYVLVAIEGAEDTERLLRKAVEAETDEGTKNNLQDALNLLEAPTFSVENLERLGETLRGLD